MKFAKRFGFAKIQNGRTWFCMQKPKCHSINDCCLFQSFFLALIKNIAQSVQMHHLWNGNWHLQAYSVFTSNKRSTLVSFFVCLSTFKGCHVRVKKSGENKTSRYQNVIEVWSWIVDGKELRYGGDIPHLKCRYRFQIGWDEGGGEDEVVVWSIINIMDINESGLI